MNYLEYIPKFEIPSNPLTYYFPIEHARAQEAKLKGMTVELLLELERKNQQSPGVVIEDKRDAYQNMRASVKNNPRESQRQKEGEAKAKENAAKVFNGILAMGMPSTYYNLFNLDNLLSTGLALALDLGSGLLLSGIGVATGRRALQKSILQSAKRNYVDLFTNGPVRTYGKVKYYGPTMGKTTASNSTLIDFDNVVRPKIEQLAKSKGVSTKDLKIASDPDYVLLINDEVVKWQLNPANEGKTLMISNKALSNPSGILFVYDNTPSIPSRDVFIRRLTRRGAGTEAEAADYYDALLKENPNLQLDNRFVSQIENGTVLPSVSKLTEGERLGIPKGGLERFIKNNESEILLNAKEFAEKYGYDVPETIESAKDMYKQHNRWFRTVQIEPFKTPLSEYGFAELTPELQRLSDDEIAKVLASKGYPSAFRYSPEYVGLYLDEMVFASPSMVENAGYLGYSGAKTVMLLRPFSLRDPLNWHISADYRPISKYEHFPTKSTGVVQIGNTGPKHEIKLSTQNLIPVKIAELTDKGTRLGEFLGNIEYQSGGKLNYLNYFK